MNTEVRVFGFFLSSFINYCMLAFIIGEWNPTEWHVIPKIIFVLWSGSVAKVWFTDQTS